MSAWPYFTSPGLPRGDDAELHIYRTAELGYSLQAGSLYPRWAPNFYHGYGYPIFNYYAPLTYYVSHVLTLGRPELAAVGVKICSVLALVLGAVGAYLLGSLYGGKGGGLLGTLAFSFAPYIQLINPHVRGDLPETFALACLPWALWAWEQVWRTGRKTAMVAAVSTTAAAFLSHNLTGLSAVALVAGLGLWQLAMREGARQRFALALAVALVFVLLTAFFWLPFLWERSAIQLDVAGEGHYDFRNHFVALRELLSPIRTIDRRATAADVPMSAGPQMVVVAVLGVGSWLLTSRGDRGLGFYAATCGLLLWLITRNSLWLWEIVPGIAYYQFPWRFLGPAAAMMIPLISQIADVATGRTRRAVLPIAAILLLAPALPGLYPPPWTDGFGPLTLTNVLDAELEGRWRGTTSTNDFVPATVDMIPGPEATVLASYSDPPVDRVNRATLPAAAVVEVLPDKPWVNRFSVRSDESFTLRLFLFHFPGWRAYIDGEEVPIEIARPEGFITLRVPAGHHDVAVRFGSTPARTLGWGLSGVGGLILVVLLLRGPRLSRIGPSQRLEMPDRESGYAVLVITAVCLIVALGKVTWLDHTQLLQPESPPNRVARAHSDQQAYLSGEIDLLGHSVVPSSARPGQLLEVTLYWQARRPLDATYQSFVHLVQPEGEIRTQSDHLNPGGFPTDQWPTDRYIIDRHRLQLPDDLAAGTYLLSVGLYSLAEDGARLRVDGATCGGRADSVVLCTPVSVRTGGSPR